MTPFALVGDLSMSANSMHFSAGRVFILLFFFFVLAQLQMEF